MAVAQPEHLHLARTGRWIVDEARAASSSP